MSEQQDPGGDASPTTPDEYTASYMKGSGRVLLRDRAVSRAGLAVMGLATLWCGLGAVASFAGALRGSSVGVAVFLTAMAALFSLLGTTLTVVRTVVSEGEVFVQLGFWGPRVRIGRIVSSRVVPYDWKQFGGWGIKRNMEGTWAYVLSARGDVVELVWTDESGEQKKALFSAQNPREVVAAIEQARAASRTTGTRVVVGDEAERVEVAGARAEAAKRQAV